MTSQQQANDLLRQHQRSKIAARNLSKGDRVGSGETVAWSGIGARTPRGKVEVILEDESGKRRLAILNASTMISVQRETADT